MREFLSAVWNAPKDEFTAFVSVFMDTLLYLTVVLLVLVWLWRKANAPQKK